MAVIRQPAALLSRCSRSHGSQTIPRKEIDGGSAEGKECSSVSAISCARQRDAGALFHC